jgi:hypothetical protein
MKKATTIAIIIPVFILMILSSGAFASGLVFRTLESETIPETGSLNTRESVYNISQANKKSIIHVTVKTALLTFEPSLQSNKFILNPFLVSTGNHIVKVLGTKSNISFYKQDADIITTLVKGKAKVFNSDNKKNGQYLKPNAQSRMNKKTGVLTQQKVDPNHFIAWKLGNFCFSDRSLEDMMKVFSKYDVDVYYHNNKVKGVKFTRASTKYN